MSGTYEGNLHFDDGGVVVCALPSFKGVMTGDAWIDGVKLFRAVTGWWRVNGTNDKSASIECIR